jgi:hypothetical protein
MSRLEEIAEAAQRAYARHYDEDGVTVAADILEGRWTEDVAAGLCLILGYKLHGVVAPALFGSCMDPDLIQPLCEALLAEALEEL